MTPDVLIIGAGAIGLSIAHTLTTRGLRVTLLDAGEPGKGASWASAGILAPQGAHPHAGTYLDLSLKSRDLYGAWTEQLKEDSGVDIEYRAEGGLHVAMDDEEDAELESRYRDQQALNLPVDRLCAQDVLALEPSLSPDVRSGLFFKGMHQVDNRRLVRALTVAVGCRGGLFVRGMPVTALRISKGGVTGVDTPKGPYKAGIVINAAGAWARMPGGDDPEITPPVRPVRGQMLSLDAGTISPFRHAIHGLSQYLVPRYDGHLHVGATVEKVGFDANVTAGGIAKLLTNALRMAPCLESCPVVETWAGLRPMSKDGKPVLGPTAVSGLVMAAGHYRQGILWSPLTAQLIADYVTTSTVPAEMEPFLLERFLKKRRDAEGGGPSGG